VVQELQIQLRKSPQLIQVVVVEVDTWWKHGSNGGGGGVEVELLGVQFVDSRNSRNSTILVVGLEVVGNVVAAK
jgi:hypothetical protein